jgi:hypothetical protein
MKKSVSTNIPRKRKAESSSPRTSLDSQTSKGSGRSSLTKRSKTPWDIKTHLSNLQRDLENSNSQG